MLNDIDKEFCNDIRRYGEFIARYNKQISDTYDETESILIYRYENVLYYIVMRRGEFLNYFKES